MISFRKIIFDEVKLILYAKIVGYYKSTETIPIWNFFEIMKGDYSKLYKKRPLKNYPYYFKEVWMKIFYQLEKVDMTSIRKINKVAYLRSMHATTGNVRYLNDANFLEASISNNSIDNTLNELVTFIEEVFNSIGSIDVRKMSASRFWSLYHRANKKIKQQNANSKEKGHNRRR